MSAVLGRAALTALASALLVGAAGGAAAARARAPHDGHRVVAVVGAAAAPLRARVLLDPRTRAGDVSRAEVIWLVGALPRAKLARVLTRVHAGAGLVVVARGSGDLALLGLRATEPPKRQKRATIRLAAGATKGSPLRDEVVWTTAPQVGRRLVLAEPGDRGAPARLRVVARADKRPLLLLGRLGRGRVAVVAADLTHASNRGLRLWPYFNYLLHVLTCRARSERPATFGRWSQAPLPSASAMWLLAPLLLLGWIVTLALFFKARRYSRAHPEVLETFFANAAKPGESKGGAAARRWNTVGFVRPLAGFLTLAGILFLLFAPYYWLNNLYVPNEVQPFPQANGIWEFAWEALQVAWFLFDAGTFVAFIKYFAEFRVKDPREAVRSAQFFVWWQILTGLVQLTFACLAAVLILPHTRYGYTASFVMLVALGQYPGFFLVVTFFFQAYQRFDYNLSLDLLSDWLLRFALQIPFVLLFRAWGAANPRYGEAFGAAIGIGVGYHVSTILTFGIGTLLYRRLGLRMLPLFMAHFDRGTARRMLRYGLKVVAGKFFFRVAQTVDRVVISLLLANYTEWLGLLGQIANKLLFLIPVAYRFFETAMAAISEAFGNGKRVLTQYYVVRFFQVAALYGAIAISLMVALGPLFVREAMAAQWQRAADYLFVAAAVGALTAPAWLSDMVQKGADRPELFAYTVGIEQVLRIGLFFALIPTLQFTGFYLALLGTIALKVVGGWTLNHYAIVRMRLYFWGMFVAPLTAGAVNYALLRAADALLGVRGQWPVAILFFAGALASFFVCFFVNGLMGGFDDVFADELDGASRMTGVLRPLTRLFYRAAALGCRLSPLQNRWPVDIADEAMREARELEAMREARERGVAAGSTDA